MSRVARSLQLLLVAGLAVGTATHLENIVRAGVIPRPELPLACNLFWASLVLLDPLVAAILLWRPRVGVSCLLALMGCDLLFNFTTLGLTAPVIAQLGYAMLVVIAFPILRRATARRSRPAVAERASPAGAAGGTPAVRG